MGQQSRRTLLRRAAWAAVPLALGGCAGVGTRPGASEPATDFAEPDSGAPVGGWDALGQQLRGRYTDLRRHFVFEYYPWYRTDPWFHWDQWDRTPPVDIAATRMPLLGPYDSSDRKVIEQHAEWIAESGAGAINVSWWGRSSFPAGNAHTLMDVMAAHDIRVMFHLEPYPGRNDNYVDDIAWLIEEYGERRNWDAMLMLRDAHGREGPVFKSFRTIVAPETTDCHGVTRQVTDHTPDDVWKQRTDAVRERFHDRFDHVTLLADSLAVRRATAAGFDGCAPYSTQRPYTEYRKQAARCSRHDLLFSFNCNPGYDGIARREVPEDSCYVPTPFSPAGETFDWSDAEDRERARRVAQRQIQRTLRKTVEVQLDPRFTNARRGFFLVFLTSFNEWHEGHQFEPAKPWRRLSPEERAVGYHNAENGFGRIKTLQRALRRLVYP